MCIWPQFFMMLFSSSTCIITYIICWWLLTYFSHYDFRFASIVEKDWETSLTLNMDSKFIWFLPLSLWLFVGSHIKKRNKKKKRRNDKQNYKKACRKGTMKITEPHLNLIHDDETKHHTLCSSSYARGNLLFLGKIYAVVDYVLRLLGGQSTKKQKSSQKT